MPCATWPPPILYLILARGGSKRLPGKNLLTLDGVSLTARAILRAQACVTPGDRVAVSTDSLDIAAEARSHGAGVIIRPPHLADDDTTAEEAARHALPHHPGAGYVCLVQPTSPFAPPEHVQQVVRDGLEYQGAYSAHPNGRPTGIAYCQPVRLINLGGSFCHGHPTPAPADPLATLDIDTLEDWQEAQRHAL